MSRRPTTFRVGNIPSSATLPELKDALVNAMAVEECDAITIEATIAPATTYADDDTNTALVTFSPQAPKFLGPLCKAEDVQIDTPLGDLSFDKTFYGLTQLYPTTPDKRIEADIVAVTGLDGHAFGSWRGKGELARMWLRDFFAKDLPTCRTMAYGYNTKLGHHSIHTIADYKIDLLEQIKNARTTPEQKRRPLIFIGHSFGGIVTLQALVKSEEALEWDDDPETHSIYQATKAVMFFGTPHHGLPTDDILSMIDAKNNGERAELVKSIGVGSPVLSEHLTKFGHFADRLKIFNFYERQKTRAIDITDGRPARTGDYIIPVDTDSALLNLPYVQETAIPVDGDHSTMVKFNSQTDRTYKTILSHLRTLLKSLADDVPPVPSATQTYTPIPPGPKATKDLIDAVTRWDAANVRMMLESGVSPNVRDLKGVTVLHHAARTGDEEIVTMLVKKGADTNVRDFKMKTPGDYARSAGHGGLAGRLMAGML